ncbi:antirestriction protein ArdC [Bradyrhizobium sp. LA6.10]
MSLGPSAGNGRGEGTACHASQNILILWGCGRAGFSGQSWLTFRQALSLGGHVRKGERGTTVVYADRFVPEEERKRAIEAADEAPRDSQF